jgi:hypothetical protein
MMEMRIAYVVETPDKGWWVAFGSPFAEEKDTFDVPDGEAAQRLSDLVNKWLLSGGVTTQRGGGAAKAAPGGRNG